jgi:hypothetical protein
MEIFSIGAALRSERIKTARRINQCESFVKIAILTENISEPTVHGNIITFECDDDFQIEKNYTSKGYEKVFPYKKQGNRVIISVPDSYILSKPILYGQ